MKIVLIDTVYGFGSTGKIVETLHSNLKKDGHDVKSFYGRGAIVSQEGVIKISADFEVFIDAILSRLTGFTGIFSWIATAKMIGLLEIFKPDIVHVHEVHGYYINYYKIFEYLKKKDIPIIWTLHCESAYTGRCGYAFDCEQWKISCVKCPSITTYPKSLFFDRSSSQFQKKQILFSSINKIVFAPVSNWLNNRFKQSFVKMKKSRVVYNGINTKDLFYPRDVKDLVNSHNLANRHVVLSVAPDLMSEIKGGKWVLKIAEKLEHLPVTFIMIGVKEKISELPDNVICLPPIKDQNKLAEYYSLADIYMLTSERETFSLTCAESLACGTPVIGFNSGGPLEVAPEPFGLFVNYGAVDQMISLIEKSVNGHLNLADAKQCRVHAVNSFSNEMMYESYKSLYMDMLKPNFIY